MNKEKYNWKQLWLVTKFEFIKQLNIKGDLIVLAIILLIVGIKTGADKLREMAHRDIAAEIVTTGFHLENEQTNGPNVKFVTGSTANYQKYKSQLLNETIDGIVVQRKSGTFELHVIKKPAWENELRQRLANFTFREKLNAKGISSSEYAEIAKAPNVTITYLSLEDKPADETARSVVLLILGLSLLACIGSFGVLFESITGEKTQRISEVILSSVPAQIWIDGKVIAITLHGVKAMITFSTYIIIAYLIFSENKVSDSTEFSGVVQSAAVALVFVVTGLCLWNSLFAAVASFLENSNKGWQTILIGIPALFFAMSVANSDNTDNWFSKILSFFPLSSPNAMPLRWLDGTASWVDLAISYLVLLGAVLVMRFLAGSIFRFGMLMYGKPASIKEIARWIRA